MMKNSILFTFILLFVGMQQLSAKVSFGKTEKIKIVHEFPNTEEYMSNPGRFFDLGILYETFSIAGAPLWVTKDPILVGTENMNTEFYLELDEETPDALLAEHNLQAEEMIQLSFMDKHAGIVYILGVVVIFMIWSKLFGDKNDDVIEDVPSE